eukprot:7390037-Prymnesium_polylepis.1
MKRKVTNVLRRGSNSRRDASLLARTRRRTTPRHREGPARVTRERAGACNGGRSERTRSRRVT